MIRKEINKIKNSSFSLFVRENKLYRDWFHTHAWESFQLHISSKEGDLTSLLLTNHITLNMRPKKKKKGTFFRGLNRHFKNNWHSRVHLDWYKDHQGLIWKPSVVVVYTGHECFLPNWMSKNVKSKLLHLSQLL